MKKLFFFFTIFVFCLSSNFAQDTDYHAKAAKAGSVSAVNLSMIAWGVGLTAAIIIVCLLIKNSASENAH